MLKLFISNPQYRKFLFFQIFDGLSISTFAICMMWAVHFQYQNTFYTGLAGVMFAIPAILNFVIGPFVDARNKVTLIRLACLGQLAVIVALLVVPMFFELGVWFMLLGILAFSIVSLIAVPAGVALLPRIVGRNELVTANALFGIVGTVIGVGVGMFLYAALDRVGFEIVYAVVAALLVFALISSAALKSVETKNENDSRLENYFVELKEGLSYAKRGVMMLLLLAFVVQDLIASVAYVNIPMLAQIHSGYASGYVVMVFVASMGGIIGSYLSKILEPKLQLWKVFVGCFIFAGIARIIFVIIIVDNFLGSLFILLIYAGLGATIGIFSETLFQKMPPKHMVARINTIFVTLLGITSALGAFLGGVLGSTLPEIEMVFMIQGSVYIAIALFLSLFKRVRVLPKIGDIDES